MLTGAAVFVLLLIALLAIPVTLRFRVSSHDALQNDVRLEWAFGLVRVRIPLQSKTVDAKGEKHEQETRPSKRTSRKRGNVFGALRQERFRRRMLRFVTDLWRAFHKRDLSLRLRVGLGDPADTGQLWAVLGPTAGLLATIPGASIRIEPEFLDPTLELDTSGSVGFVPLRVLYLSIALLMSPPVWRGLKAMRATG